MSTTTATKTHWKTMTSKPVDRSKRIAPGATIDSKNIISEKARGNKKDTNYKNLHLGLKADAPQRIQKKRSTPVVANSLSSVSTYKRNRKSISSESK